MHFSFWEKTGFAVLIAAWVLWGSDQIGDMLVHADELAENAYKIEVADAGPAESVAAEEKVEVSAVSLLASASADGGAKVFKKCQACHSVEKGGANKVGPNLYNTVGGKIAGHDGFSYSGVLAEKGGQWTYEDLDQFLKSPKDYAPGTKMTFAGLRKASDRAEVILYLREYTDNPPPLP